MVKDRKWCALLLVAFCCSNVWLWTSADEKPCAPKSALTVRKPVDIAEHSSKLNYALPPAAGEYIYGRKPWGHVYEPQRIFCMVPMLWAEEVRERREKALESTILEGCDGYIFVYCANEGMNMPRNSKSWANVWGLSCQFSQSSSGRRNNVWDKVWRMWLRAGNFLDSYDWFVKLDSDTFFSPSNFKNFVKYYDPERDWYLGHTVMDLWEKWNVIYNAGPCYVLSRGALRRVLPALYRLRSNSHPVSGPLLKSRFRKFKDDSNRPPPTAKPTKLSKNKLYETPFRVRNPMFDWLGVCELQEGIGEDRAMGNCLRESGVIPTNTLDSKFRQRFLLNRDWINRKLRPNDEKTWKEWGGADYTWYFANKIHLDRAVGENCCADDLISLHNYKSVYLIETYFPQLYAKYQPNSSSSALPPEPSDFLFNISFKVDKYYNIEDPPAGMIVWRGYGKKECWKCNTSKHWTGLFPP